MVLAQRRREEVNRLCREVCLPLLRSGLECGGGTPNKALVQTAPALCNFGILARY